MTNDDIDTKQEAALNALWRRRVAFHVAAGWSKADAEREADIEVYGGDVIPIPGGSDHRIREAKEITGDA